MTAEQKERLEAVRANPRISQRSNDGPPVLTRQELLVLVCLSHGLDERATAELLGKGMETVKSQSSSARYRLQAKNTTEACCEAIRRGLIP